MQAAVPTTGAAPADAGLWAAARLPAARVDDKAAANRLPGVDGLRALAALWVVLFHIHAFSGARFGGLPGLDLFLRSGSTGVSLFLVLSGFCLFLPFARGRTAKFQTGAFFVRRCRRLMPAYYVSLALTLALVIAGGGWLGFEALTLQSGLWQALTHLTLTHTLFENSFYALNGAYWSLGLEWQLYLALPLLILASRRFGLWKTLTVVIAVTALYRLGLEAALNGGLVERASLLGDAVLPNLLPGRWAEFAYGMIAAELYATRRLPTGRWRLTALFCALLLVCLLLGGLPLRHMLYGAAFFVLLILVLRADNPIARVLAWGPLVALGTMSYSLYLVHQPLVQGGAHLLAVHHGLPPMATFLVLIALLPLIVLLAWVLYQTVERRSLTPPATARAVATGAMAPGAVQSANSVSTR